MSVIVAKSAGFCFGVNRAVETVETAVQEGKTVVTLGPIIHNRHVVNRFDEMGVRVISTPEEAQEGMTVVIRSHGVSKAIYERLQEKNVEVIDATCPFVKRIHGIVSQAEQEGRVPIIMGTRSHPEVEGIAGWCHNGVILESAEELAQWVEKEHIPSDLPVCMVSQTTSTENSWKKSVIFAKKQFTNLKIFDTKC